MQKSDDRSYKTYLPVVWNAPRPDARRTFAADRLRIGVSYNKDRKCYVVSVGPVADTGTGLESNLLSAIKFANLGAGKGSEARYNGKRLLSYANEVDRQLLTRDDHATVWKVINQVLAEQNLKLVTPATGKPREQIITEILAASRKPCPQIVERFTLLCEDGNYYFVFGIPNSTRPVEPTERRSAGFAYQSHDGTTYGTRETTREGLELQHERSEDHKAAEFRKALEEMTDEKLENQAIYWLKMSQQPIAA